MKVEAEKTREIRRSRSITSIETALRVYYENFELGSKEIIKLFGEMSDCTVARYKNKVRERMAELGVQTLTSRKINTKVAYEVWGIDVNDLEKRQAKLIKLGLLRKEVM